MSETLVMPDAQQMIVRILKTAGVAGGRVYGALPSSPAYPLIITEHVNADLTEPVSGGVESVRIQLDAYADAEKPARDLAYEAWEALRAFSHGEVRTAEDSLIGWVSAIVRVVGPSHTPEPSTNRQRYTVEVVAHVRAAVTS